MRIRLRTLAVIAVAATLASACGSTPPTAPSNLTISTQPQSQTVASGSAATLNVTATGTGTLSYQWYVGTAGTTSSPIQDATARTYTTPGLTATTNYWVRIADATASIDSVTATVAVAPDPPPSNPPPALPPAPPPAPQPAVAPAIARNPESRTITSGETATLIVEADGTAPLTYQWYAGQKGVTSSPVSGATSTGFTTPALTATTSYWVRVSNTAGSADSAAATITVLPPPPPPPAGVAPAIASHPQSQTVTAGQAATLNVIASGTAPLGYQWYIGSSGVTSAPVAGATSATFTTPALSATTSYWVRVTNTFGAVNSNAAIVTVVPDTSGAVLEDQVFALINQRRAAGATCGGTPYPPVPALAMNSSLRTAARLHSQDMAANNYFSHTSLDGTTFDQRIRNAGYAGSFPWGENIAAGPSTAEAVVDGWMASPGHCANIMSPSFRATGIGYGFGASAAYRHYWTQTFGGS
ncbi:MAG: CAP domain-containing protein [Acidobacteriota bacterium]